MNRRPDSWIADCPVGRMFSEGTIFLYDADGTLWIMRRATSLEEHQFKQHRPQLRPLRSRRPERPARPAPGRRSLKVIQ